MSVKPSQMWSLNHDEAKEKISSKHANEAIATSLTPKKKSFWLLKSFEIDDFLSSLPKPFYWGMDSLRLGTDYDLGRGRQLFQWASWEASGAASY